MKRHLPTLFLATCALATAAAWAQGREQANDAVAPLIAAKISLSQAISAAETHVHGHAVKAELEMEKDKPVIEIEVVDGQYAVYDVLVDAVSGQVMTSRADAADEEQGDEADEDEND